MPRFPLLSELVDIEIGNIDFSADQIDELREEIDELREEIDDAKEAQVSGFANEALLTLSKATIMAAREKKGLLLSPFC